ncbi:hypothetical protein ACEPAF_1162 [Sanghuangporus sanghuang]
MGRDDALLPLDIFEMILVLLGKTDLISFAGTSRYWRDRLLPKFFRSLCLRVGFPVPTDQNRSDDEEEFSEGNFDDRDKSRARRSKELLERLASPGCDELDIAHLVRELSVIIAHESFINSKEKECLLLALKRLPELRRFAWTGHQVPSDIAQILATSHPNCSIALNFRQPSQSNSVAFVLESRLGFSEVVSKSNHVHDIHLVDDREEYITHNAVLNSHEIRVLVDRHWRRLKRLALCYHSAKIFTRQMHSRRINGMSTNLTHLLIGLGGAYADEEDRSGIETFLLQVSALESLTLLNSMSLSMLPRTHDALSKLRELKIGVERYLDYPYREPNMRELATTLRGFVLSHTNLHRFDFMLWVTWQEDCAPNNFQENAEWFSLVLDAVCSLEQVSALGLTFPGLLETDMQGALERVVGREELRRTCTALRLGALTDIPMQISLPGFSKCSFFAVSNGRPLENTKCKYRPPSAEELVSIQNSCRLQQLCLNGRLYDILSTGTEDRKVVTKQWSKMRVSNRTETDFCSEDGHWLMKYREISKWYEVARSFDET